jgi:EAL domain-containing protein (putative c-di-GMP-specific phosphodiesterase class I)
LKRLPIYELKIDRSFIQGIPNDVGDRAIVPAIVSVARHLALHVVAEGVETSMQSDFLTAIGCECMQGYLFGKPLPLHTWLEAACEHG